MEMRSELQYSHKKKLLYTVLKLQMFCAAALAYPELHYNPRFLTSTLALLSPMHIVSHCTVCVYIPPSFFLFSLSPQSLFLFDSTDC